MITECWTPQSNHRDTFFSIYTCLLIKLIKAKECIYSSIILSCNSRAITTRVSVGRTTKKISSTIVLVTLTIILTIYIAVDASTTTTNTGGTTITIYSLTSVLNVELP